MERPQLLESFERLRSLPAEEAQAAMRDVKRKLYTKSLYALSKHILGYKDINHGAHYQPITALERATPRKLIVMPRGTFKTSLTSVAYPIWLLLHNPDLRILLDSELYTNSKLRLREIRNHLLSDPFRQVFGNWIPEKRGELPWSEGEATITARVKKTLKEPTFTCSGIGAQKTGNHYDVIIADDLNSPKNTATAEQAQKVIDHYRMYTSLLEPKGILVVVGTRYSATDLIEFILTQECGVKV